MNIVHVLETLDASGGGLPAAVKALALAQQAFGHQVFLLPSDGHGVPIAPERCGAPARGHPTSNHGSNDLDKPTFRWRAFVESNNIDVCHVHGVWNIHYSSIVEHMTRRGIVTVLSPHGQLMPALLGSDAVTKKLKKRVFWNLVGRKTSAKVSMIHALGKEEFLALERLALGPPVLQIPNFVDRHLFDVSLNQVPATWDVEERVLLFLGRIDRRKGLANLVDAFVKPEVLRGWRLEIVGPVDDEDLAASIRATAASLAESRRVTLEGPVFGDEKLERIRRVHAVCLPSYSEAAALVNIEAALMGRVVITTPQAGIDEIASHGGVVCSNEPAVLRSTLESLSAIGEDEYRQRCLGLQAWARSEFAYERIIAAWNTILSKLIGRRDSIFTG